MVWSPCSSRDSQDSSLASQFKSINSLAPSLLYDPNLTSVHDYWKTIALIIQPFVGKVMSLLFIMLPRFVIGFLPRSKHLLISWLQSPPAVTLEHKKIKPATVSTFSPFIYHEAMGPYAVILVFECWVLSHFFHSLSLSSRGSLVPLCFLPLEWYHLNIWDCWYFSGNLDTTCDSSTLAFRIMYSA